MKNWIIILFALVFAAGIFLGLQFSIKEKQITPTKDTLNLEGIRTGKTILVAVNDEGKGVSADLITEIRPGTGLILVNINNILADYNTQYSARIAAQVAGNYTNTDLNNIDITYHIKANATIIAGPSAGANMAVSTIALLQNKTLNPNVVMTGAISEDGKIGEVGAIVEKAKAAKSRNANIFLVPAGFGTQITEYEKQVSCGTLDHSKYCEVVYQGKTVDLGKDIGIEIKEVKDIKEALEYFYK